MTDSTGNGTPLVTGVGLVLLLYPLITAANRPSWPGWAIACLTAGALVLAGFVVHQRRLESGGRDPVLRVRLLRIRSFAGGLLMQLLFLIPIMGFFLVFLQFLQVGLGEIPLQAGLILLPWSVMVALLAGVSAVVLLPKIGRVTIQLGLIVMAVGFALLALTGIGATPDTGWAAVLPGILIGSAGMGLVASPIAVLTLTDLSLGQAGTGSALFSTTSQLGASVGIAVLGTVFFSQISTRTGGAPGQRARDFGGALAVSLWLGIGLLALAFAASFLLPRRYQPEPRTEARLDT